MCRFIIISSYGPNSLIQMYNKQWGQFTSNTKSNIAALQTNFHDYPNQWESTSTWALASMRTMAQPHESTQWDYHSSRKSYSTNLIEQFIQHIAKYSQEIGKNKISSLGWVASDFIKLAQRTESTSSQLIQHFSTTKVCSLVTGSFHITDRGLSLFTNKDLVISLLPSHRPHSAIAVEDRSSSLEKEPYGSSLATKPPKLKSLFYS